MKILTKITRKIPFVKLDIGEEEKEAVLEALNSGELAVGKYIELLEREFARYVGVKHAISVSNGTDGLFLAYLAFDLTFGKKILTTPITFVATASTIIHVGSIPLFADVGIDLNIDPKSVKEVVNSENVDAICLVHVFGKPVEMQEIYEIIKEREILIIEDASHAHGAEYGGKKVGSLGDIAVFSLYPTKIIAAGGWGGLITTNSDEVYEKLLYLRAHGEERVKQGSKGSYLYSRLGYNLRLSNIEAAVAYYQLKKIDYYLDKRRRNAKILSELLGDIEGFVLPEDPLNGKHSYYIYNVLIDVNEIKLDRDWLVSKLNEFGIPAQKGYHVPLHKQKLFLNIDDPNVNHFAKTIKYPDYRKIRLPNAEIFSRNSFWLPIHPGLEEDDIVYMVDIIKKIIDSR